MRLRDRRVQMTYPVRLTCQVTGCPDPDIEWYKDGAVLSGSDRLTFSAEDTTFHTLEIDKSTLEDSGVYTVRASNKFGSVACKCHLVVDKGLKAYIPPRFSTQLEPNKCEVQVGGELRLSARVEAYPSVGIMWYKDGVSLLLKLRFLVKMVFLGAFTPFKTLGNDPNLRWKSRTGNRTNNSQRPRCVHLSG